MVSAADRKLPPTARAVLASGITGGKRRKLAALIAIYADAGVANPSITELAKRTGFDRETVVALVESLEAGGVLVVDRTGTGTRRPPARRATYRLTLNTNKETNNTMNATKTHTPILAAGTPPPFEANWIRPLETVVWPEYRAAREAHVAACEAVAAAGDLTAEAEGLRAACDAIESAALTLPGEVDRSGEAAMARRRAELQPPAPDDEDPFTSGVGIEEIKARIEGKAARREAESVLVGAEMHEALLAFRRDYFVIGAISNHGSPSRLAAGLGYLPGVRRRILDALADA